MLNIIYIWLAFAIIFLIAEMVTVTFYGLSMSVASFFVVAYIYYTKETSFSVMQFIIFSFVTLIVAFTSPKLFTFRHDDGRIGNDANIGKTFKLKKVGDDFKISVDGVDFLVDNDCVTDDFASGKKVVIVENKSGAFSVKLK